LNEVEEVPPLTAPSQGGGDCDENKCKVMPENFDEKLEEKIENNKGEKEQKNIEPFIIHIPQNAVKQDLIDLKFFMEREKT
jgi:hypothetical protein